MKKIVEIIGLSLICIYFASRMPVFAWGFSKDNYYDEYYYDEYERSGMSAEYFIEQKINSNQANSEYPKGTSNNSVILGIPFQKP